MTGAAGSGDGAGPASDPRAGPPAPAPIDDPDLPFGDAGDDDRSVAGRPVPFHRHSAPAGPPSAGWPRSGPRRRDLRADAVDGASNEAIASVPDGMAMALLVGVNRVRALRLLRRQDRRRPVQQHVADGRHHTRPRPRWPPARSWRNSRRGGRDGAVVALTLITGIMLVAVGLLRLGRYIRFVSRSVMVGFLTGHLGEHRARQAARSSGGGARPGVAVQKALYVATHLPEIGVPSALVGLGALAGMVLLGRTRLRLVATLIAVDRHHRGGGVRRSGDGGNGDRDRQHPGRVPGLTLPDWRDLVNVDLICRSGGHRRDHPGAGCGGRRDRAESRRQPVVDQTGLHRPGRRQPARRHRARDPVGGSVSTTAINLAAGCPQPGGRTVFGGLWMLVILMALGGWWSSCRCPRCPRC